MKAIFAAATSALMLCACAGFHLDVGGYIGQPPGAPAYGGPPQGGYGGMGGPIVSGNAQGGQCMPAGCRAGDTEVKRWTDQYGCTHTQCVAH